MVSRWSHLDQRSYSTLGPVSTWMGDRLRAGKLSRYVTSHPGQLSLAIPLWVGAMSTRFQRLQDRGQFDPYTLVQSPSISRGQFRAVLKTHLFNQAYTSLWERFVLRVNLLTYLLTYCDCVLLYFTVLCIRICLLFVLLCNSSLENMLICLKMYFCLDVFSLRLGCS